MENSYVGKTRALFVGSNPSAASKGTSAFCPSTKSGKTLYDWIRQAGVNVSVLTNVADYITNNNKPLSDKQIRLKINSLKLTLHEHKGMHVIAVGKTAAKALKMAGCTEFYEMPHPSGLNRQLNDPEYVAGKIKGLQHYIETPLKSSTT